MITALLALAVALLVTPGGRRGLPVATAAAQPPARRWRRGWFGVVALTLTTGAAVLVPTSLVLTIAVVGGTVALRRNRSAVRSRSATECRALQDALDVLAGELRVGVHPVTAFESAAAEVPGEVATALRAVAARARLGVDVASGLRSAAEGSAAASQWTRLAVCWDLAQRHGLAIATLVRTAHREFVENERFESQFAAAMAGARTTAVVLAGLPVLGIGLGQLVGANPLGFLSSGGLGGVLLVVGALFGCAGLLWSDRITTRRPT